MNLSNGRQRAVKTISTLLASLLGASVWASGPTFTDVTLSSGIDYVQGAPIDPFDTSEIVGMTGGAAAADYDGDGWVDLFVTRHNDTDILYRNVNGQFVDVSAAAFGASPLNAPTNGAAWGDIDNDGDKDLYVTVTGATSHLLYVNQGDGTFTEQAVARGASVGNGSATLYGTGVAFGDYDRDGYLDVFASEWRLPTETGPIHARLLHNRGSAAPGHFEDTTTAAGVSLEIEAGPFAGTSYSFSPRFSDLDGDRWPDLAITSDFSTSRLFWNEGNDAPTQFSDGTISAAISSGRNDMGSAIGDIDGDGRLDWFITDIYRDGLANAHPNGNRLFRNDGERQFSDITDVAGVRNGDWGWGTAMLDYDNDGDLDITMTNGFIDGDQFADDPMRLWQNNGTGQFTELGAAAGVDDTRQGRGLLTFDYDNDGDLDIFVVNNGGQPVLLRNDGGNDGSYLRIRPIGTLSNRDGVGALITVTPDASQPGSKLVWEINSGSHYLAQSELTAHFGLGDDDATVDEVQILWPSGVEQRLYDVAIDGEITVLELAGDFNSDGEVDESDLAIWHSGLLMPNASHDLSDGDANADGVISGMDYLFWQRGHLTGHNASSQVSHSSIPEPSAVALAWLATTVGLAILNRSIFCNS